MPEYQRSKGIPQLCSNDASFEAFLRQRGVAVMPVVEARRSYLDSIDVKSPDFIVVSPNETRLVVDVKGRKFTSMVNGHRRRIWKNWCERQDVLSLAGWADRFGSGFRGVLAFVYELEWNVELPRDTPDLFAYRGRLYLLRGVGVNDYRARMRTCSPRWKTVHLRAADFRELVHPISHFLAPDAEEAQASLTIRE